jgi:hypothetical protein
VRRYTYRVFAQESVEHPAQDGLESGGNDVEGNVVLDAVVVEVAEVNVQLEFLLHDFEAVVEGDVERPPHFF